MYLTWNSTRSDPKSSVPSSTTGALPVLVRLRWPTSSLLKRREWVGADSPGWLWMVLLGSVHFSVSHCWLRDRRLPTSRCFGFSSHLPVCMQVPMYVMCSWVLEDSLSWRVSGCLSHGPRACQFG